MMTADCRDVVETCFGASLRKVTRMLTQAYDDALRPADLRLTQFTLLATLNVQRELTMTRFADLMAMERSALARNLKPLERRDLVAISEGSDRRTRLASLTEHGRQTVEDALPLWEAAQARLLDELNVREQKQLATSLELVTSAVSGY
jgi:DNA-binding MarR family transcriptional regulator